MSAGKRGPPKTEAETVKEPLELEIIEETAEETTEETTVEAETPSGPAELGERLRLQRENTAQMLALFVVGIFGMVSLLIIVCGFGASLIAFLVATSQGTGGVAPPTFDALEAAKILLPYLATPLGVAMGYYFTRQAAEQKK
jgi:hypothetical protein